MLFVGSTLITRADRAATGRQQEEETRRRRAYILRDETSSWHKGHTGKDTCPSPGGDVAQGGRGSRVQLQEDDRLPDGATAVRTSL